MSMLRGTLDPLVLKTVSWSPMHAFEITNWIEERSDGRVQIDDAALLQALHRLEDRGYLAGEWGVTENPRRAKYYSPRADGPAYLPPGAPRLVVPLDALVSILSAKTSTPRG